MARSENNLLLKHVSGKIGNQLVVKQYGNKTVLSIYPDMSRRKLSEKQVEVTEKMTEANYYAKGIIRNEKERNAAQIRLNVTRNKLYTALIKDFFAKLKSGEIKWPSND